MEQRAKKILKYSLSVVLALVLLYFSFRGVEWSQFFGVLGECHWGFVVLSTVAGAVAFAVRSLRWKLMLLPVDKQTKFLSCFNGVNIGKLADFVVPHLGEFVRCGVVSRHSSEDENGSKRASYDKVLGTVVLERTWDIVTLFVLIVLLLSFAWGKYGSFFMDRIVRPASDALDFSLWWIVVAFVIVCAAAVWAVYALRERSSLCAKAVDFCKGLVQGAVSCMKMPGKWAFLLYTLLLWALFLLMSLTIIWALPESFGLGWVDALFLMLAGSVAGIVPVPGGFGAFHYVVALALSTLYGVPWEMGIIFATLSHESQAIMMALLGLGSYVSENVRKNSATA